MSEGKQNPQVIVQYVTKNDQAAAPTCAEIFAMLVVLGGLALAFGWLR